MASVAEDVLPLYSTTKQYSSLRRRRFTISLLTIVAASFLLFSGQSLFARPHTSPLPLDLRNNLDHDILPTVALTSLGLEAEQVYHLGSLSLPLYRSSLESFLINAFPPHLVPHLTKSLHRFLDFQSTDPLPERPKIIWQTNDVHPVTKQTRSWEALNQGYDYRFLKDRDADNWVHRTFKGSAIEWAWDFLPHPVMKADLLRYLLLLVEGGIYSDIDTACLRPIAYWGIDPDTRGSVPEGPPTTVVGIEADVGDRADWHQWWSRPLQIVQWTIASNSGHPALLDAVRRIYDNTVEADRRLRSDPSLTRTNILAQNLTVLEWTGPAVFTDSTLRFLRIESDLKWPDLRGLTKPLRTSSVTVLPVTGFSPGVGNFGSKDKTDKQAMVHHEFKGSWKDKKKKHPGH